MDKIKQNINITKNINEQNINNINDEEEEIDEIEGEEKGEKGGKDMDGEENEISNIGEYVNNDGLGMIGNKNFDNENLELIEQIKYFTKEVEKLEKENNITKQKIKEYDNEYNNLKEELKSLNLYKNKSSNK